jgi:hypothetical protein
LKATQQTNYIPERNASTLKAEHLKKKKMELILAERYKQFEAAYSNFKTRYSPRITKDGSTSPKND